MCHCEEWVQCGRCVIGKNGFSVTGVSWEELVQCDKCVIGKNGFSVTSVSLRRMGSV